MLMKQIMYRWQTDSFRGNVQINIVKMVQGAQNYFNNNNA